MQHLVPLDIISRGSGDGTASSFVSGRAYHSTLRQPSNLTTALEDWTAEADIRLGVDMLWLMFLPPLRHTPPPPCVGYSHPLPPPLFSPPRR